MDKEPQHPRVWVVLIQQTREHLFNKCSCWKPQQKTLWTEARKAAGRRKNRFKVRDLFADERCTRTILDFLCTTEGGRRAEPRGAREAAQNRSVDSQREWSRRVRDGAGGEADEG